MFVGVWSRLQDVLLGPIMMIHVHWETAAAQI